ncbi:hypothetical protein ATANTOWER_019555, partial [Ataeniobius toweri]|nr:hypothetical protein [Ataeniobius toweri]
MLPYQLQALTVDPSTLFTSTLKSRSRKMPSLSSALSVMTSKSHQRTARNKLLEIQKQAEDFVNDRGKWNEEERHVGRKKMRYRSGSLTFEPQADPDGPSEPTCSDTEVS